MACTKKCVVVAAAFVAISGAHADTTLNTVGSMMLINGVGYTGTNTLSLSDETMDWMTTGNVMVGSYGSVTISADNVDHQHGSDVVTMPITAVTVGTPTTAGVPLTGTTSSGGITLTESPRNQLSYGGSLAITDLRVDLANKAVYGTIIGSNGVNTLSNVEIWTLQGTPIFTTDGTLSSARLAYTGGGIFAGYDASTAIVGSTNIDGAGIYGVTLNGLVFTSSALTAVENSLGLLTLGKAGLQGISSFGTINIALSYLPVIPEPSTYALMGLGLVGLSLATRRRQG